MSRTAASAPFFIYSPNDAYWPVIGPAVAIRMSAWALVAARASSAAAAVVTMYLLMRSLLFPRSEEHTSELQSLMRISYAVFCLKKKKEIAQQQVRHQPTHQQSTQ